MFIGIRRNRKIFLSLILILILIVGFTSRSTERWEDRLYTPTMINKIDDLYFIVDCWHHRIIYSDDIEKDISQWSTLVDNVKGAHSITTNGSVILIDDTDNSRVLVFKKVGKKIEQVQVLNNIDGRPHYVLYDEITENFFVISSEQGVIWSFKENEGRVELIDGAVIDALQGDYVRSINIIDGYMYTVSGGGEILKLNYVDKSFNVLEGYSVPDELFGMNFLTKIQDYYYITSYTNILGEIKPKFIRVKELEDISKGEYEEIYNEFNFKGTPYYISQFDDAYYITEIDNASGIKSFEIQDNNIINIKTWFNFEDTLNESIERKKSVYN